MEFKRCKTRYFVYPFELEKIGRLSFILDGKADLSQSQLLVNVAGVAFFLADLCLCEFALMSCKINAIGQDDVHRITSGQVIIDLTSAVKELVDNSIDAHASTIEIKFKNYGLESVECSDDGDGILAENYEFLARKHYTSKIANFDDIFNVQTLGFRGEALSSLCAISNVTVTTTTNPPRADKLEYDFHGELKGKFTTTRNKGSAVTISNLFTTLPVRYKEFTRTYKRQFSKCISVLQSIAIIQENIKFTVWNFTPSGKKQLILSTVSNKGIPSNILSIFGSSSMHGMSPLDLILDLNPYKAQMFRRFVGDPKLLDIDYTIKVCGYISRNSFGCGRNTKDRQFVYINKRPVEYPLLLKCCNEIYRSFNNVQYPAVFLDFELSPQLIDVNVTPDKRTVLLHSERYVTDVFKDELTKYFDQQELILPKSSFKIKKELSFSQKSIKLESSQEENEDENEGNFSPPKSQEYIGGLIMDNDGTSPIGEEGTREQEEQREQEEEEEEEQDKEEEQSLDADISENGNSKSSKLSLDSFINPGYSQHSLGREETVNVQPLVIEIDGQRLEEQAVLTKDDNLVFVTEKNTDVGYEQQVSESEDNDDVDVRMDDPIETNIRVPMRSSILATKTLNNSIYNLSKSSDILLYKLKVKNLSETLKQGLVVTVNSSEAHKISEVPTNDKVGEDEDYLTLTVKKEEFLKMQVVGQFNLGFIIVTRKTDDKYDLFIVDQHASDEKYNFEMMQRVNTFKSQTLVVPQPLELNVVDELLVLDNVDIFEQNGFKLDIDEMGSNGSKVKLRSLPVSKRTVFGIDDFYELIHLIKNHDGINKTSIKCSKIRSMFAMRACRSSVMIGKPLNKKTMSKIVKNLSDLDKPWNCPHGRPTMRHLTELKNWRSFNKDYMI